MFVCHWLHAVAYIAKVRILEQITTNIRIKARRSSCCLYSKGKNFRANHNSAKALVNSNYAVAYIAKVRILEQITTLRHRQHRLILLLLI